MGNIIQNIISLQEQIIIQFNVLNPQSSLSIVDHTGMFWKKFALDNGDTCIETNELIEYLGYRTRYNYDVEPIQYEDLLLFYDIYRHIGIIVDTNKEVK